jgi:hypothetical protein
MRADIRDRVKGSIDIGDEQGDPAVPHPRELPAGMSGSRVALMKLVRHIPTTRGAHHSLIS